MLTVSTARTTQSRIAVVGPEGGEVREILTGTMARYAASGHVVYATADGTLLAAPFDQRRLEVTGPSVALVEGVLAPQFALSESGTLLYGTGTTGTVSELVWVSRAGQVEPVDPAWTGVLGFPALSPDGTRLAMTLAGEASADVWVKQLDQGPSLKLTFGGSNNIFPTWTPDGASVTFRSDQAGPSQDLWTKRADGSAQAVLEVDQKRSLLESLWSPDGEWLLYDTPVPAAGAGDILALRPGQDTAPIPLVATGDVLYHAPHRRPLQDVLTCIRAGVTIQQAGLRLAQNAERHLKPPAEMARLFRRHRALAHWEVVGR